MNSDEQEILQRCLGKTKDLFQRRNRSEDWAENIIRGSAGLTTPEQWKHYYVWLANPKQYNEESTNKMEIDNSLTQIDDYPDCMEVETFQNGPCETVIHVKNKNLYPPKMEEKTEE